MYMLQCVCMKRISGLDHFFLPWMYVVFPASLKKQT